MEQKKTLYGITGALLYLLDLADAEQEFDSEDDKKGWEDAWLNALGTVADDFNAKLDGYGAVLSELQRKADAVKAEKMRLSKRQASLENNIEDLKSRIVESMKMTGQQRVKGDLFTFSTRKSESVNVTDLWSLPEEYLKYSEPTPDKVAIKADLKAGCVIKGAELINNYSLLIK